MQFKEQKLFFNTHTNSVNLLTKEKYENIPHLRKQNITVTDKIRHCR